MDQHFLERNGQLPTQAHTDSPVLSDSYQQFHHDSVSSQISAHGVSPRRSRLPLDAPLNETYNVFGQPAMSGHNQGRRDERERRNSSAPKAELGLISDLENLSLPKDAGYDSFGNHDTPEMIEANVDPLPKSYVNEGKLYNSHTGSRGNSWDRHAGDSLDVLLRTRKVMTPSSTPISFVEKARLNSGARSSSSLGLKLDKHLSLRSKHLKSPAVFSDDEFLINDSDVPSSGRRSAPIFSRRGLTGSEITVQDMGTLIHGAGKKTNILSRIKGSGATKQYRKLQPERLQSAGINSAEGMAATHSDLGALNHQKFSSYDSLVLANQDRPRLHEYGHDNRTYVYVEKPYSYPMNSRRCHSAIPEREFACVDDSFIARGKRDNFSGPYGTFPSEGRLTPGARYTGSESNGLYANSNEISNQELLDLAKGDEQLSESLTTTHSNDEQQKPALEKSKSESPRTEVYKRRWYLLLVFALSALLWNAVWSTWGPIAQSAKDVFGWSDGDIAMFTWLGNIPFLVTMFPIAYLMDVKGMRIAMVLSCGLAFLGTGLRCIPCDVQYAKWPIYAGQLLNGVAGTVPMSGPALLSGLWFPPNQRATATAFSTLLGYFGACISFVIGPLLVPEPYYPPPFNGSSLNNFKYMDSNSSGNGTADTSAQKAGIMNILYAECGAAGVLFLLVIIYFPSKPPHPPSVSASIPREKYLPGLKMLARNKQFWVTAVAYSVPIGVYEVWQVVLDVIFDSRVSQETAGWMDFYATLGGCISGMLVSRFADYFTRQMKLFLLVFYFFSAVAILWCTLVVMDILPFDVVSIYAAIVIGGVFLDGGAPLFFELVIEVSYPVGEGVTSGCLQMICASAGILFLSILQIESIGKLWMNWFFFGTITMAMPLLFFIKTTYGRADIDDCEVEVSASIEDSSITEQVREDDDKTQLLKAVGI